MPEPFSRMTQRAVAGATAAPETGRGDQHHLVARGQGKGAGRAHRPGPRSRPDRRRPRPPPGRCRGCSGSEASARSPESGRESDTSAAAASNSPPSGWPPAAAARINPAEALSKPAASSARAMTARAWQEGAAQLGQFDPAADAVEQADAVAFLQRGDGGAGRGLVQFSASAAPRSCAGARPRR